MKTVIKTLIAGVVAVGALGAVPAFADGHHRGYHDNRYHHPHHVVYRPAPFYYAPPVRQVYYYPAPAYVPVYEPIYYRPAYQPAALSLSWFFK